MSQSVLFTTEKVGSFLVKNRFVMAPMTRCRAKNNIPNALIAEYYGQRARAGLIITEGVSPSPNGLGYARIPGIFTKAQVAGWKLVTKTVHDSGGKIFVQLMHTGRISHPANMPIDSIVLAPSAVRAAGQMWTDSLQMQDFVIPKAMSHEEFISTKAEFVFAAKNAMLAGFDGVELHAANGYLLEQFLNPISNVRSDNYGGSIENRSRFVLEVAEAVAQAIGKEKTGIRISPYGVASDMAPYADIDATYDYLSKKINDIGLVYIHILDHSAMGAPTVPSAIKRTIRENFKNTIILAGGYDLERAEADLLNGFADLIAFGRPFINNPDLVERYRCNLPLSGEFKADLLYTADKLGYTDYPNFKL